MSSRYILQPSQDLPNWWVLTDVIEGVVIRFEEHRFDETQRVTLLDESHLQHNPDCANKVAHILREMTDYLIRDHYFIAMPMPAFSLVEEDGKQFIVRNKPPRFRMEILDETNNYRLATALKKCAEWLTKGREFR